MSEFPYDILMDSTKEINDIFYRFYRLQISNVSEIDVFFKEIDDKYYFPSFFQSISNAANGNNRYIKSYLTLIQKIYENNSYLHEEHVSSNDAYLLENHFNI